MSFMTISDNLPRQAGSAGDGMNAMMAWPLAPWTHSTQWWMAWWVAWIPASMQPVLLAMRSTLAPVSGSVSAPASASAPTAAPTRSAVPKPAVVVARAAARPVASKPSVLSVVPSQPDDLTRLEGIGPKIAERLHAAGIQRFDTLAQTPVERLQEILAAAGARFKLAVPDTWPEQAALLAAGDMPGCAALTAQLTGGRR